MQIVSYGIPFSSYCSQSWEILKNLDPKPYIEDAIKMYTVSSKHYSLDVVFSRSPNTWVPGPSE